MLHLREQVLILKTLLCIGRHSPRVDDLPPSNVGKLSLSKLGQLVPTQPRQRLPVKDGQLICQINSNNLSSNLSSYLSKPAHLERPSDDFLARMPSPVFTQSLNLITNIDTNTDANLNINITSGEVYKLCLLLQIPPVKNALELQEFSQRGIVTPLNYDNESKAATIWYLITFLLIELFCLPCFHWNRWNPSVKCCMNWNMAGLQFM